jgi:alpha-beta hydrolase superfamily lysophospholipase
MTTPTAPTEPRDHQRGMDLFAALQTHDGPEVNPVCHAQLLTHGHTTDHVILFLHGMTNCPRQFVPLGQWFFDQGFNVLIPREPHNGLLDRNTRALAQTTVPETKAFCRDMANIAYHLGRRVTVVGISAGGTLAAYMGQSIPAVDVAIPIAPLFGIVPHLPAANAQVNWLAQQLCLRLPNLMTQSFRPFTAGPEYGYFGFATHGLGQMMRLGAETLAAARRTRPAAAKLLMVINDADPAVNIDLPLALVRHWQARGADASTYHFPADQKLIHDIIDPNQPDGQKRTAETYPILQKLILEASA